ncbi:hypothetical protein [Kiloniella sp.]|uniref:hypothetical protein n=1 Tax=Kiloniella sp. TaxID=1938587 RepID=UPI003B01F65A
MLIVIYLLYVKLSETIHINRLLGGRHLFLLNKAEKSQLAVLKIPKWCQGQCKSLLYRRDRQG